MGLFLHEVLPGGWLAVAGMAALNVVPVRVLVRGFSGLTYPAAATRLLVLRPFSYGMLILPLLAVAGVLGAIVGIGTEMVVSDHTSGPGVLSSAGSPRAGTGADRIRIDSVLRLADASTRGASARPR